MPIHPSRLLGAVLLCLAAGQANAFCGFYVGKADANLFNKASQVILVRSAGKTVISMLNDYRGELKEFALVVPVPQVLQRGQIHIGDKRMFERIDAYSAPRLAEYYEDNPCARRELELRRFDMAKAAAPSLGEAVPRQRSLGVTVEAAYTVGEYDIVILSAKESDGLETWLLRNGYRIPRGASAALKPYIRQDMKFFVAKVNLKEQARTGLSTLRPLQFAFESEKFMLPLRLGMINADGPQDLIAYVLTRSARVEASNYRTVKLPANMDLPVHIRAEFTDFYKALFEREARKAGHGVVFTEYFWDMSWCDPCAADPLSQDELRQLGVFWLGGDAPQPMKGGVRAPMPPGQAANVLLTRLHVRYDAEHFPEDLVFTETRDRDNFQGRYILNHPYTGEIKCETAKGYVDGVRQRRDNEAQNTARLTGWSIEDVRKKMGPSPLKEPAPATPPASDPWWKQIWK